MRAGYTSLSALYIFEEFCNEGLFNFLNQKPRHPSKLYPSVPLLPFHTVTHHQSLPVRHLYLLSSY